MLHDNKISQQNFRTKKNSKDVLQSGKKKLKLVVYLMRMAPKIIEYAKNTSHKLRKKNSYQLLIFPKSSTARYENNELINQSLIKQYKEKKQNWYDFYFEDNKMFIENHHLEIFSAKKPIQCNFSKLGLGRILFFGENIGYCDDSSLNSQQNTALFMGTQTGEIIIFQPQKNAFGYLKLVDQLSTLSSICYYSNNLLAFTKNAIYVLSYEIEKSGKIGINLLYSDKFPDQKMSRAQFVSIRHQGELFLYVFYLNIKGLWRLTLKKGIFNNIQGKLLIQASQTFNPFTNMKIFYERNLKRLIITVTCTKQAIILSHHLRQCKTSVLHRMNNPKNPPPIPRVHIYNCIQYFYTKLNFGVHSQKTQNQHFLLVAISFTERIYFIRIWPDYCEMSRRAKFQERIFRIFNYKNDGIIIVCEKTRPSLGDGWQDHKDDRIQLQVVATRLEEIVSFYHPVLVMSANRIDFRTEIFIPPLTLASKDLLSVNLYVKIIMLNNKEILILNESQINRVAFNRWKDIYMKMRKTQNVQLLYFLILLKNYSSTFLSPIEDSQMPNLQIFFPTNQPIFRQILLQYYYETRQPPPIQFIANIQNNEPQLLLPFILTHKVQNLNDHSKQMLVEYYRKKDQRVVQELIISGVDYGWEMAVSNGWMRALRKMVEMGMEIHFPLLKLSSFIISLLKQMQAFEPFIDVQIQQSESQSEFEDKIQSVKTQLTNYSKQIIDYTLLALDNFLRPQDIEELEELQQFLLALMRQDIFICLIRYCPKQCIKLLSKIFNNPQRISLIQKLQIQKFLQFSKIFKHLIPTANVSISEIIYSHISQSYREITQKKPTPPNLRLHCRHLLFIQHAKLIKLKSEDNASIPIKFIRKYLIQMLYSLASNDNQDVKLLITDAKILLQAQKQQVQCYIQDFLAIIWQQAKASPSTIQDLDNQPQQPKQLTQSQLKQVMNTLEQINNSNSYLLIKIMQSLSQTDYCTKILKRYLQSNNIIIRTRIFTWISKTIQDQYRRKIIQSQLMLHLSKLIEIDKQKSREIFDILYAQKERQIIRQIDNDPLLQLQYLEMIIDDTKDDQKQNIQENFLGLHIRLLIVNQPERVIQVLEAAIPNNVKYDLHQALKTSLEIQSYPEKNRIQTYLFEKVGEVQKCIRSYLKMLGQCFWAYAQLYQNNYRTTTPPQTEQTDQIPEKRQYSFDKTRKTNSKISLITQILTSKKFSQSNSKLLQLQQKISTTFREMQDLILRQPVKKYQYVALPLNILNNFFEQIQTQQLNYKQHYESILIFYLGEFIVSIFEKGYIRYFIFWLQKSQKVYLSGIKEYIIRCYANILSQQNLLENISQIDRNVLVMNINQMLVVLENSIFSEAICCICEKQFGFDSQSSKKNIIQQDALLFNCGHLFHKQCVEQDQNGEDYCWQCIYNNQIKAMIENVDISLVDILKKYSSKKIQKFTGSSPTKIVHKQQVISISKKRTQRMGIFDKRVSSLQNQVIILDMKLQIIDYYQKESHMKIQ